jgi:hypothetical protein
MFTRLVAIPLAVAATVFCSLSLAVFVPGCGTAAPQVDKAAEYSAETIAQELAFRYKALMPDAKKSTRSPRPRSKSKSVAELESAEKAQKKTAGGAVTKKRTGPPTIDDVLDDIDDKISMLKGTSRSEARKKIIEAIAKDQSLAEEDRQALNALVGRLED